MWYVSAAARPIRGRGELGGTQRSARQWPPQAEWVATIGQVWSRSAMLFETRWEAQVSFFRSHCRTSLIGAVGTLVTSGPRPSRPDCEGARGDGGAPEPLRIRFEAETIAGAHPASRQPAGGEREAPTELTTRSRGLAVAARRCGGDGTPLRSHRGEGGDSAPPSLWHPAGTCPRGDCRHR